MARYRLPAAGTRLSPTRATPGASSLAIVLLFLISTSQVFSHPILENEILEVLSQAGSSSSELGLNDIRLQSLQRFTRMTPFWRMVGSKPLGAYCVQGLECTTKLCRKGHCAYQQQFES